MNKIGVMQKVEPIISFHTSQMLHGQLISSTLHDCAMYRSVIIMFYVVEHILAVFIS